MNAFLRRVAALLLLPALARAYAYTATEGVGPALLAALACLLLLLGLVGAAFRWPQARWLLAWQAPAVVGLSALTAAASAGNGPSLWLVLLLLLSTCLTGRTLTRQFRLPSRRVLGLLAGLLGGGVVLAALCA